MLNKRSFILLFFFCSFIFAAMPLSGDVILVSPAEKSTVKIIPDPVRDFWSLGREERLKMLKDDTVLQSLHKENEALQISFSWKCTDGETGPFKIEFFCNDELTPCPHVWTDDATTNETQTTACNFEAGRNYFWRVSGKDRDGKTVTSKTGNFTTFNEPVRLLSHAGGVSNMRDIGGRKGLNGKMIRQGMIYRSAGLNDNSPDYNRNYQNPTPDELKKMRKGKTRLTPRGQEYLSNGLGIKTDLDLRRPAETAGMTGSPIGESVHWVNVRFYSYNGMFEENGKKAVAECFRVFCDRKNYPVVFHCIFGMDRTGSLAFVLEGVLGADPEEMLKDFEISSYDNSANKNLRDPLLHGFDKFAPEGASMMQKIEGYLFSCGITKEEIETFRSIMLE